MRQTSDWDSYKAFIRVLACRDANSDSGLANLAIRTFLSYRLPESAKRDAFIGFRELKRVLFTAQNSFPVFDSSKFIFDSSIKTRELRKEYLHKIDHTNIEFIARDELASYFRQIGFFTKTTVILKGVQWALLSIWSKNRANTALFFRSIVEFICLIKILDSKGSAEVFDFNQFEVDSNLFFVASKSLFKENLVYRKFPSPGPLELHNSILLTDILCYNTPYHLDEIKQLTETVKYKKVVRVPMEQFFSYGDYYREAHPEKYEYDLAYYSHASWLRKQSDHADDGLDIFGQENKLLSELANYINNSPDKRLVIFTHPRERKTEVLERTKDYYNGFFHDSKQVDFCDLMANSSQTFGKAKIGIGVYSTILFERLACGYPTLLMTTTAKFPIRESTLSNIVVQDEKLHKRLSSSLKLEWFEFYQKNHVEEYLEPYLKIKI